MKFRKTKLTQLFLVSAAWKRQRLVDVSLPKHPWKLQYSFPIEQWLRRDPGCRCLGEESRMNPLFVECLKDRSLHVRIRPWISIHMFAYHLSALSKILSLWWRTLWPKKNFKTNKLISIYPGNLIWVLKMMLWQNVTLANIWLFGVST